MKTAFPIIFVSILMLPAGAYAEAGKFVGCGDNKDEAVKQLARSIATNIKQNVSSKTEVSSGLFGEKVNAAASTSLDESSDISMSDLKFEQSKADNQTCVSVTHASFKASTVALINEISKVTNSPLPKKLEDRQKKYNALDGLVKKAKNHVRAVYVFDQNFKNEAHPDTVIASAEDYLVKLKDQLQVVHFDVKGNAAVTIKIDGLAKHKDSPEAYRQGTDIFLEKGKHGYTVAGAGLCDLSGSFDLAEGADHHVEVDQEKMKLPVIHVTSNQPGSALLLKIDGKKEVVGKEVALSKCSGTADVELIFTGSDDEPQKEKVDLAPGLKKSLNMTFVTLDDKNRAKQIVEPFRRSDRLEVLYSYSRPTMDTNNVQYDSYAGINNLVINYSDRVSGIGWLRHGVGGLWGRAGDNFAAELYYSLIIQGTSFGSKERPLMLGSVAYIPFIGIQAGAGYHEYLLADKTKRTSTDSGASIGLLKYIVGVDVPLGKDFAIQLSGGYSQTFDKSVFINAGVSFNLGK